jgi:hypothetical protein
VNIASAWILGGGDHHRGHGHSNGHLHTGHDHDESKRIATKNGDVILDVFEDGVPPRFRLRGEFAPALVAAAVSVETVRPGGARQVFAFVDREGFLESVEEVPEPHAFNAHVKIDGQTYPVVFKEHEHAHGAAARDNNMRAAVIHVMADAAVSVMVIVGLLLARAFGWLWMNPLAGIVGACVIASWSFGLIRDTGAILLDMNQIGAWRATCGRRSRVTLTSSPICISSGLPLAISGRLSLSARTKRADQITTGPKNHSSPPSSICPILRFGRAAAGAVGVGCDREPKRPAILVPVLN